jgi:hypothetical protein
VDNGGGTTVWTMGTADSGGSAANDGGADDGGAAGNGGVAAAWTTGTADSGGSAADDGATWQGGRHRGRRIGAGVGFSFFLRGEFFSAEHGYVDRWGRQSHAR